MREWPRRLRHVRERSSTLVDVILLPVSRYTRGIGAELKAGRVRRHLVAADTIFEFLHSAVIDHFLLQFLGIRAVFQLLWLNV